MEVTGAAVKTEESPRALRILRPRQPGRKRVDLRFPRKTRPWPIWPQLKESVQFYSASIPPFLPQLFEGKRKRVRVKLARSKREGCVRVLFESVEILEEEEERGIWRLQVCTNYYYERERGK